MKVVVFNQWDKLVALLRTLAKSSAAEKTQRVLNPLEVAGGRVKLSDRAMNSAVLTGGEVAVEVPGATPGRAREFVLRLKADAATAVRFEGADAFVSDDTDALKPPEEGETKVYRFTETSADEFLVECRKAVTVANE